MHSAYPVNLFTRRTLVIATVLLWFMGFYSFRHEVFLLKQSGFVHFPYWDDWDTPLGFFHDLETGSAGFLRSLFSQHNESRKVTTKLLGVAIERFAVFHSDLTIDISCFIRLATVTLLCLPLLLRLVVTPLDWLLRLSVMAFSIHVYAVGPANLINGLWYIQISFFLGLFFALGCLSALTFALCWRRSNPAHRNTLVLAVSWLAGLLGCFSIFSFSGNVLLVPCAFIVMWLATPSRNFGSSMKALVNAPDLIVLSCLLVSVGFYFLGYESPPHHAGMRASTLDIHYVLNFLANVYQYESADVFNAAKLVAAFLLVVLIGFLLARLSRVMRGELPWPVIHGTGHACFLVGLAFISAIGRGGTTQGARYALSDRYNSISLLFSALACTFIVYILSELFVRKVFRGRGLDSLLPRLTAFFVVVALAVFMLNALKANAAWRPRIQDRFSTRQEERECLRLSVRNEGNPLSDAESISCASRLYPDAGEISRRFGGPWCPAAPALPSRTLKSLCQYFSIP